MELTELIDACQGRVESDLLFENASVLNVFTGETVRTPFAVKSGRITAMERVPAKKTVDLAGRLVTPGFIDAHVHIESSMVAAPQFARAVVPSGTTSVVADPHEIANVLGAAGVRYLIESARGASLDVFVMVPSCVPATTLETAGAELTAADVESLSREPEVIGLAEMMNFPGVLYKDPDVLAKLRSAKHGRVDGHAPGLSGASLSAYIAAGISSDHECTTAGEAAEKVGKGMAVFIREGTAARNLDALLPLVRPENADRFAFCTDDRHPSDLLANGHVNYAVRRAVEKGLDPALAVRLATWNPARHFGLDDRGAVAPGRKADLLIWDDLRDRFPASVYKNGVLVAERGKTAGAFAEGAGARCESTFRMPLPGPDAFRVAAPEGRRMRVIGLVPGQIVTRAEWALPKVEHGGAVSDPDRDLLKIAVIERHRATGRRAVGFVRGFGLRRGAMASSVAHDSHNCIVVGADDADMAAAAAEIARMRGGWVVTAGGRVLASLPLPVAGLLSDEPLDAVARAVESMTRAAAALSCGLSDPFMTLSFLALPVIPELKITDLGLVDVGSFARVELFEG
jgi:adenine deaminase